MPKNFQQVTALPAEHIQITSMWITMQRLLNLQGKTVHPATHVGRTRCQPDANTGRRDNHQRSTVITRRSVARSTSCPTFTDVPSGSVISILPPDTRSAPAVADGAPCFASLPGSRIADRPHREEYWRRFRMEHATAHLVAPVPQQARLILISSGSLGNAGTRLLSLCDDPELFLRAPTPPPLNPGDDLHTAGCL